MNPDFSTYRIRQAASLRDLDRSDQALGVLRALMAARPGDAQAQAEAGSALDRMERPKDDESALRRAVELAPHKYLVRHGRFLESQQRYAEAKNVYRRGLTANPRNESGYQALANLVVHQDRPKEAEAILIQGVHECPQKSTCTFRSRSYTPLSNATPRRLGRWSGRSQWLRTTCARRS